ncbi:uncharacterized protein V1518DRAFT_373416 [Limtongia smithiae]|uniref:uncharacterized protein n=1 Tax=Limtongia smithiae TaxID=1125753 RepID=UPI0034CDFB6F
MTPQDPALLPVCVANASVVACPDDNKIFIFGGFEYSFGTGKLFNNVIIIDTVTFQVTRPRTAGGTPPSGRHAHSATYWKDGEIILFGGENGEMEENRCVRDLHIYNIRTHVWTRPRTHGRRPKKRGRHAACMSPDRTKLYFCGGLGDGGIDEFIFLADIFCLDLTTMTWSESRPFAARYDHFATVWNDKVWIFGGLTADMEKPAQPVWFDLRTCEIGTVDFLEPPKQPTWRKGDTPEYDEEDTRRSPALEKKPGRHMYVVAGSSVIDITARGPTKGVNYTAIRSFDMARLRWRTLADEDACEMFSEYEWMYAVASPTTADSICLLNSAKVEFQPVEFMTHLLPLDLRYFGAMLDRTGSVSNSENTILSKLPPESLAADLEALLESGEDADFVICTFPDDYDGTLGTGDYKAAATVEIKAHLLILQTRWPHFRRVMGSHMREYHRRQMHIPERYTIVHALMHYLYTGTLPNGIEISVVARVLILSNMYALPRLRDLCAMRMQNEFDVANAPTLWECARVAREPMLQLSAARFCLKHWGRVVRNSGFRGLAKEAMIALCAEIDLEGRVVHGRSWADVTRMDVDEDDAFTVANVDEVDEEDHEEAEDEDGEADAAEETGDGDDEDEDMEEEP